MTLLRRFDTPGRVADGHKAAWSARVRRLVARFDAAFPQFYDPTAADTPGGVGPSAVVWPAFPASLRVAPARALRLADGARRFMDEYCEWAVERNRAGKIVRVTFTIEVPEYFEHLFAHDRQALLDFYRTFVSPRAKASDLERNGRYLRANVWNAGTEGRPAHLIQASNTLGAAVQLAAEATVLRRRGGQPVTTMQELVACGALGNPLRSSDPQIASVVNEAARAGAEIALADPVGLYLDGLMTGGMAAPDGADPSSFWRAERGRRGHVVRAAFAVPPGRGYIVGDVEIGGRPIEWGGQLAQRVRVRIDALVKPGAHRPRAQPCVGPV